MTTPAPLANVSSTNAARTTRVSMPRCWARPLATPPSIRPCELRYSLRGADGAGFDVDVTPGSSHGTYASRIRGGTLEQLRVTSGFLRGVAGWSSRGPARMMEP